MIERLYSLAQPLVLSMDPERAHEAALRALELGLYPRGATAPDPRLAVNAFGLTFPNPVGLAAGFDKDARVPDAMLAFGFGHVEIGSVTPLPQAGNPQPRLFRLLSDRAVINRMGFNSAGHDVVAQRLQTRRGKPGILGVNLGTNKASSDKAADFVTGLERLSPFANYVTINVSSPNTPGLRDLQLPDALSRLIERLQTARARLSRQPPLIVKLAPEIAEDDLSQVVARLLAGGVEGIAISNTTLARDGLTDIKPAAEAGGLSGRPLFRRATRMLARVYQLSGGRLPLIGIGGIDSGAAALAKIAAGATLIQLYTGMIYEGPGLAARICNYLSAELGRKGVDSISKLRGAEVDRWASAVP